MFGISIKCGAHRLVLLTKGHALKIPRASALRDALRGNRSERNIWKNATLDARLCLCPIVWGDWCGFVVLMPHARCLTDEEYDELCRKDLETITNPFLPDHNTDFKRSNYGVYKGRIVKIDYEELRFQRLP